LALYVFCSVKKACAQVHLQPEIFIIKYAPALAIIHLDIQTKIVDSRTSTKIVMEPTLGTYAEIGNAASKVERIVSKPKK